MNRSLSQISIPLLIVALISYTTVSATATMSSTLKHASDMDLSMSVGLQTFPTRRCAVQGGLPCDDSGGPEGISNCGDIVYCADGEECYTSKNGPSNHDRCVPGGDGCLLNPNGYCTQAWVGICDVGYKQGVYDCWCLDGAWVEYGGRNWCD